jgi:hypothetical protein
MRPRPTAVKVFLSAGGSSRARHLLAAALAAATLVAVPSQAMAASKPTGVGVVSGTAGLPGHSLWSASGHGIATLGTQPYAGPVSRFDGDINFNGTVHVQLSMGPTTRELDCVGDVAFRLLIRGDSFSGPIECRDSASGYLVWSKLEAILVFGVGAPNRFVGFFTLT